MVMDVAVQSYKNVYWAVFIANLPYFAAGHMAGWSSPSIPIITSDDFFLKITSVESSWVASIMLFGGVFGPFISGALLDVIGRKWTISLNMAVALLAWAVIGSAWSVYMLYIGRFLCGITYSVTFITVPMYIAEISEPKMRGMLNNLPLVTRSMTVLFQYSVGPFVSYHTLIVLSCFFPILFFLLVFWMPESPYFLLAKGRKKEAENILTFLRGEMSENVLNKEISDIQAYIDKSRSEKGSFKTLFNKQNRKIVFVTLGLLSLSQLVGVSIVVFYLQPIFESSGSSIPSSYSSIIVGVTMGIVSFFAPAVAKLFGCKKPMIASSAGTGISLAVLGGCFFLRNKEVEHPVLSYIPIISLLTYIVFLTSGMLNLPWAAVADILPSNIKAQASAFGGSFAFLVSFFTTITFPLIVNIAGADYCFWLYSCFCLMTLLFVYFFIPETKGLTLNEIQDAIKLPSRINKLQMEQNGYSPENVTSSYLKNHFEINFGPGGTYMTAKNINE